MEGGGWGWGEEVPCGTWPERCQPRGNEAANKSGRRGLGEGVLRNSHIESARSGLLYFLNAKTNDHVSARWSQYSHVTRTCKCRVKLPHSTNNTLDPSTHNFQAICLKYEIQIRLYLRIKGVRITRHLEIVGCFLITNDLFFQRRIASTRCVNLRLDLAAMIEECKQEAGLVDCTAYCQETMIHKDGALFTAHCEQVLISRSILNTMYLLPYIQWKAKL